MPNFTLIATTTGNFRCMGQSFLLGLQFPTLGVHSKGRSGSISRGTRRWHCWPRPQHQQPWLWQGRDRGSGPSPRPRAGHQLPSCPPAAILPACQAAVSKHRLPARLNVFNQRSWPLICERKIQSGTSLLKSCQSLPYIILDTSPKTERHI